MSTKEILEYNKKCAEFLGREYSDNRIVSPYYTHFSGQNPTGKVWEECKFHSDWNWIMEVIEAIEKTYGVSIVGGPVKKPTCVIYLGNLQAVSGQENSKKEAVVQAINQFLIWYEQNK